MKKILLSMTAALLLLCGCGSLKSAALDAASTNTATSGVMGSIGNINNAITNVLTSVIGTDKLTSDQLVGMWKYNGPGCAFSSEKALAKAGGEVVATSIKEKLSSTYKTMGYSSANTYITINNDSTFAAKLLGKSWSGRYTYSEADGKIELKGLLLSATCYVKRNGKDGLSLLFDAKKLLTLLQTLSALSGNANLEAIGEISKNYSDVKLGYDLVK